MLKQKLANRLTIYAFLLILVLAACGSSRGDDEGGLLMSRSFPQSGAAPEPMLFEQSFDVVDSDGRTFDSAAGGGDSVGFAEEEFAGASERIVIKNGDVSIAVKDPAESMDVIREMADDMGGYVVSSNLYQARLESGQEVPQGNITIRVPAERFREALEEIESAANQVLSRNESGQDVTREYTDLQSRLRNLEDTEAQLREIMASAVKTEDVLRVYNELSRIRGEIEMVKGQIQYYEQAAALSAISVTLVADEAVQPLSIGGWQPAGVAKEAVQALINTLQSLANTVIWLIIYVLPTLLAIAIPVWLVWRKVKGKLNLPGKAAKKPKTDN